MPSNHYDFIDRWTIPASQAVTEAAIMRYEHWADWWDGLERVENLSDGKVGAGAKFLCVWRGAAWYKLRLGMNITVYKPGHEFSFDASGDLKGSGRFHYETSSEHSTTIKIDWNVSTTKPWMNTFGWLLRPVFIRNHARIMSAGEKGLAEYVRRNAHPKGALHGKQT